ncbi:MAG: galactokinase [Spirochaetales bacterium]
MGEVGSYHQHEYDEQPSVVRHARGVINAMGAYTEATRGVVLLFGTNYEASVSLSRRSDGSMRIYSVDLDERQRTSASALRFRPDQRFAGIAKGVLQRLRVLGYEIGGLNATITSTIPSGSGFAASQAIGVAFARSASALFGRELSNWEAAEVAFHAERRFLQIHVGFASFLGAAFGEPGKLTLLDMNELTTENLDVPVANHCFYVITTDAPAALSASDEWHRDERCEECLQTLTGKGEGCSFQEVTVQELADALGTVPEESRRWCSHIVRENERVHELVCAIEEGDLKRVGLALAQSHRSLSDLYEASFPEVDWLVKHADRIEDVQGARLVGGRQSTSVLVCSASPRTAALEELLSEYQHIFGFSAVLLELHNAVAQK